MQGQGEDELKGGRRQVGKRKERGRGRKGSGEGGMRGGWKAGEGGGREEKHRIVFGFLYIVPLLGFKTQWIVPYSELLYNCKGCDEVTR